MSPRSAWAQELSERAETFALESDWSTQFLRAMTLRVPQRSAPWASALARLLDVYAEQLERYGVQVEDRASEWVRRMGDERSKREVMRLLEQSGKAEARYSGAHYFGNSVEDADIRASASAWWYATAAYHFVRALALPHLQTTETVRSGILLHASEGLEYLSRILVDWGEVPRAARVRVMRATLQLFEEP